MKTENTFEQLEIWKEGMALCVQIYELMSSCKDYGLKIKFKEPLFRFCLIFQRDLKGKPIKNLFSFYSLQKDRVVK